MSEDELVAKMEDAHYHGGMRAALAVARREVLREAIEVAWGHATIETRALVAALEALIAQPSPAATPHDTALCGCSEYDASPAATETCEVCERFRKATP